MKLELEVLASTSIKRKKPWPRLAWVGETQESIFLLDAHRVSVLYVPSGKTRRRVPKLQPLLEDVTALNHSDNGQFMVGLLRSGDAFLWHKDTDMLKYIQGLPELAQSLPNTSNNANRPYLPIDPPSPYVCIADDGSKMVVVVNRTRLFVWEKDADQVLFAARNADVKGSWTEVRPSRAVSFPESSACETAVSAVFFINDALGLCCLCSLVFTVEESVCVTTAVMRWYEPQHIMTYSKPTISVEWTDVRYKLSDLAPGGAPVRTPGSYVTRASHDGQLLAVAINQKNSSLNRMMFVSPLTDTVVVSDLRGMGAKVAVTRAYRTHWVTDLAWTADDLFTIVMTKQGSVAMVARLGEPVLLCTFGCSLDMGPRYYLPLHPLISVKVAAAEASGPSADDVIDLEGQAAADQDPMRQRFSISCHPRLPIFLCSDGYMVTALQLPADLSCLSLMKGLVMESNHHLRRLRDQQKLSLTLYDSMRRQGRVTKKLSLSDGVVGGRRVAAVQHVRHNHNEPYRFEEPEDDALNHSLDEDQGDWGPFGTVIPTGNMESGKLFFGDMENLNMSADLDTSALEENLEGIAAMLEQAQKSLLLAWSLGASHCGLWTEEHEDVTTNVAHNVVRLFSILLQSSDDVLRELLAGREPASIEEQKNPRLGRVLRLMTSLLQLLRLDAANQHLMVCSVRFVQSTMRLLLTDPQLGRLEPRLTTLHGSFILLTFIEKALSAIYTPLPKTTIVNSLPVSIQQEFVAAHEPPTLCEYRMRRFEDVSFSDVKPRYEMSGVPPEQKKLIRPLPGQEEWTEGTPYRSEIVKRLGPAWKLLYKHTMGLYKTIITKKVKVKLRRALTDLLVTLQVKLTSIGQGHVVLPTKKRKVQPGCRLSIEGCSVPALKAWMYQLNIPKESGSGNGVVGRLLLSTLYSLLLQDELRAAIELTELLLRQPDVRSAAATCRQDQAKKWSILAQLQQDTAGSTSPPQYIQNKAVRAVVRSIARIMAAYFSNRTLFVFPPHAPRIIPPLHRDYTIKHRVIPLYHESLANVVRQDGLGGVWTAERAVDYLLLSGLLPEAAWFADTLGDWKTAFTLGVAQSEHQRALPHLYTNNQRKLDIPETIQPDTVLQGRLAHNFGLKTNSAGGLLVDEETDLPALRRILADLMLAAVLSRVDLVPWLLEGLVTRLRIVTTSFPAVVPPGLYLPAPPLYCPQPANTSQAKLTEEDSREVALRHEASSLIQLVFLVLEGANCTLPSARWYAHKVDRAVTKGRRFKPADAASLAGPDVPVLQTSFLQQESAFSGREDEPSVHRILAAYRNFCAIVWLLYVRDKLSLGLRKKLQLVERKMKKSPVPPEAWLKHCRETLHWAACMVPFAHFLEEENEIFGITLSLITELPPDQHACQLLCQFFYDAESLDPELQDKLQAVLKDWQGVFIDHPSATPREPEISPRDMTPRSLRGTSLSFYFHKQAQRMEKHFRRKAKVFGEYEVFVFDPDTEQREKEDANTPNGLAFVGSRPFESEDSYLEFLDVFYAVSFHKSLDAEEKEAATPLPLLSASSAVFREKELMSLAHKAVTSLHRKQQMSAAPSSTRRITTDVSPSRKSLTTVAAIPSRSRLPSSPRAKVGLFRSRSFNELSQKRGQLPPSSPAALRKKSSSHQDLSMLSADEEDFMEVHASRPRPSPTTGGTLESPRTGSRYAQTRQLSGSDTQLTANNVVPKMTLARRLIFRRSSSVNDVDDARKEREQTKSRAGSASATRMPTEDPLLNPVVPSTLLDRLEFGESFSELEQLMEWLTRWAGRNHTLNTRPETHIVVASSPTTLSESLLNMSMTQQGTPSKIFEFNGSLKGAPPDGAETTAKPRPAMRIKVHPRMVVYSLWLVENQCYTKHPPVVASSVDKTPGEPVESTKPQASPPPTGPTTTGLDTAPPVHTDKEAPGQSEPGAQPGVPTQEAAGYRRVKHGEGPPQHLEEQYLDEQQELEESYRQQIISAESNESLSDGLIPEAAKRRKKMGILKKKKKKEKKKGENVQEEVAVVEKGTGPEVGTSDTLMRRLSFNLSEKGGPGVEPALQSHNASQVSDSTLNVSSLNDEELPDQMRQTLTRLEPNGTKKQSVKTPSRAAEVGRAAPLPDTDAVTTAVNARLLDEMEEPAIDTRLDLQRLESQPPSDEPDDLRSMVRQELRKIVEAQHRGILAMLGALGEEEDTPLEASTPHDRHPHHRDRDRRSSKKKKTPRRQHHDARRHDQSAFNTTQDTSFNDPSSLTEVDITPLPSDEVSVKSLDQPLTVSDLFRSKTWSPGARFEPREVGNNVRGALRELKTLENSQSPINHVHFDLQQQQARPTSAHPGRSSTMPPPGGKENAHSGQGQGQGQGHQGGPHQGQIQQAFMTHPNQNQPPFPHQHQPPGMPADSNQPFSRVFHMLKQMNQDMASQNGSRMMSGGFSGGATDPGPRPPLLHVAAPGVRFPRIPVTGGPMPQAPPPGGAPSRMPLLHLYTPHHTDEVPVRDLTSHLPTTAVRPQAPPAPFRMQLLRMTAPPSQPRIFQHIEDERGELLLVPADEVLAYEARRQEERRVKLEQRRTQMEALGLSGPPVEAMLKKAERRDQRQTERRKQRRQKAGEEDENLRTSRENLSTAINLSRPDPYNDTQHQALETHSRHVQVEGPEMTTQEVQVTYTPTPREQSTQGMQFPTPRAGSLEDEDLSDEEAEDSGHLHHGYALTPGLFDEYLTRDGELGTAQDNSARLHYKATAGQRPRKLREVSTETDGPGWTDTGTITCRDQGTDPVAEALDSYIKSKKNLKAGGFIAPDVYMGLTFSEDGQTAAASGAQGGAPKRAFINVVDLDEAALADIVTSLPERVEERSARDTTRKPSPRKERAPRRKSPGRRVRMAPSVEEQEESEEELTGPDHVTSKVLSSRRPDGTRIDSSGPASHRARAHTKDGIRDRLGNMDMQFEAIEAMSRNMEEDYKNARLMIHTIEQIGDAVRASADLSEDESVEHDDQPSAAYDDRRAQQRPPRVERSRQDRQQPAWASPHRAQREPKAEENQEDGHLQQDARHQLHQSDDMEDMPDEESRPEHDGQAPGGEVSGLDITGLSGVSDIIGEVIASGRVDTASLGLSARQARQLASKASAREDMDVSDMQRSAISQKILDEQEQRRAAKEKERLRAWMEEKRRERFDQFKKNQQELRERERAPYKPGDESGQMSTMTFKEFEEWEKKRTTSKKQQEMTNAERRLKEASELMGDILSDKPALPQDFPARASARKPAQSPTRGLQRGASSSPSRRDTSKSPARHRVASRSPARPVSTAWEIPSGQHRHAKVSQDDNRGRLWGSGPTEQPAHGRTYSGPKDQAATGHGHTHSGGLLNSHTATSSAGLRAYTQHLENVEDSMEPDSELRDTTEVEQEVDKQPPKAYKPKPFTEKVRLQRPEATRGRRPRPAAKPYVERLSESQTVSTPRSGTAADRRAQERLYGTKRLPGTQADRSAPRTVKTYQERLREMKQARAATQGPIRRYSGPIPAAGGATVTKPMTRPMKRATPKKKPLTYSQQLKALQPPKELYRTGTLDSSATMTRSMGRGRGHHGPPHKPMTYQEQLQKLQPPKELFRTPPPGSVNQYQDGPTMSTRSYQPQPQHPMRRSGPYPSPYRPPVREDREDAVDRASVMSPWDMEDDVRRLLYEDGASSSYVGASRTGTGTDLDLGELQDLAGLDDMYYTDLVDVQDIADAASVSEGSIMSFIDWDQVNDLIADIH